MRVCSGHWLAIDAVPICLAAARSQPHQLATEAHGHCLVCHAGPACQPVSSTPFQSCDAGHSFQPSGLVAPRQVLVRDYSSIASPPVRRVYLSARSFSNPLTGEPQAAAVHSDDEAEHASTGAAQRHVTKVSCISALHPDGSVELADGTLLPNIDTVLLCTGVWEGQARVGVHVWAAEVGRLEWRGWFAWVCDGLENVIFDEMRSLCQHLLEGMVVWQMDL